MCAVDVVPCAVDVVPCVCCGCSALCIKHTILQLQIWDTAGQERFRTITQSYYRSADAIVLVYDIGAIQTYKNLQEWLTEVDRYAGAAVHKILIGNKSDRTDREVSHELGDKFADQYGMPFLETSAKTANNIEELFLRLAKNLRDMHASKKLNQPSSNTAKPNTVALNKDTPPTGTAGGGCC